MNAITTKEEITKIDEIIETTLRLLGLNNSYKGFNFLIYGIKLAMKHPSILTYICKGLYLEVAIHYGTSVNCVERNIRTAKEAIWHNGNKALLIKIFGKTYKYTPPSNAQFIDILAYYIKNQVAEQGPTGQIN